MTDLSLLEKNRNYVVYDICRKLFRVDKHASPWILYIISQFSFSKKTKSTAVFNINTFCKSAGNVALL